MLLAEKSFETFSKYNTFRIISESFALNLIISMPFTTNNCLILYNAG